MTSLDQFISDSARSYLQSVVYLDDNIYNLNGRPDEISPSGIPEARDPFAVTDLVNNGEAPAIVDGLVPRDGENIALTDSMMRLPDYHPKELMESFAEMGIVCALYEPSQDASVDAGSQVFNLCQRADVVVLDWDLYNDGGTSVSRLLANLIKQGAEVQPHHVRLCSLYTNQPDLRRTANILLETLLAAGCTNVELDADKLQLVSGATRISILGKPNVPGRPLDIETSYVVEERQLAERLLRDFCEMHKGLLSGLALKGLSSIRKNTKRLLDKFPSNLDGAFLLHRALVKHDREALDEIPDLLADELFAILDDTLLRDFNIESVIDSTLDALDFTDPGDGVPVNDLLIRASLKDGSIGSQQKHVLRYGVLVGDAEHSSSEKLGHLFSNRTQYIQQLPSLRFGTVVKHKMNDSDEWKYSICLMPICDSRNRANPVGSITHMSYPFWRLNREFKPPISSSPKKYAFVVEDEGVTVCLGAGGKIRDMLWLADIRLGGDGWARPVSATLIYDTVDTSFEVKWVAQLKPLHAQRIAAHVGTEASRVGLSESEWLRRLCDKN